MSTLTKGEDHYILVNRRPFYDLIFILTTSLRIPASQSTYNTKSLEEFKLTLENDQEEGVKTVYFSPQPIAHPFMSQPYLDRYGKPKSQYIAPLIIISEVAVTDKLLDEDFDLKAELNAEIKKLNIYNIKWAALTTLERTTTDRFDIAYPPTAEGDDHIKYIHINNKTK